MSVCPVHNQIEVFQSIKDDPLTTCETCGGTLRKRIYPVGIAFKGSGFYVNDYAPKSEAKGEAKAEAKPDERLVRGQVRNENREQGGSAQGRGRKARPSRWRRTPAPA